jgi:predicted HTH transcriptional regulator
MLIRKLSVIYAAVDPYVLVFGNTVEVNLEHMLMAIRDINEYRQYMVELVNTVGLTEPEKHVNSIIEMIYRHPRITRHEIAKELKIGKKDMDSALATCLDRGAIRQNKISEDNVEFLIATA